MLVTIKQDAEWSLFDRVHMQDELSEIFGRKAHFYSWTGLVNSATSRGRSFSVPWRIRSMLPSDRNAVGHIRDACRRIASFVGPVPAADFHMDR